MDRDQFDRLFDLTGRVAIVTGGTRGIGRSIAEGLAAAGASVVVASRKADACAETQADLEAIAGEGRALGVPTHLGEPEDLTALVDTTVDRFGGLDIVVNDAATALAQFIADITPEAWQKVFDVNLRGPVLLVQAALPHLRASEHAAVLNISSAGAFLFSPFTSMYAATKAGMLSYTRSMAAEFAADGIRVNALAPGTVDTDMVRANDEATQERMAKAGLLRRAAHPDEMVGPALLLVSDAGSFITGQTLLVDGGLVPR